MNKLITKILLRLLGEHKRATKYTFYVRQNNHLLAEKLQIKEKQLSCPFI